MLLIWEGTILQNPELILSIFDSCNIFNYDPLSFSTRSFPSDHLPTGTNEKSIHSCASVQGRECSALCNIFTSVP
jgi:hypothetical protein